jgi:hypothetical protein
LKQLQQMAAKYNSKDVAAGRLTQFFSLGEAAINGPGEVHRIGLPNPR